MSKKSLLNPTPAMIKYRNRLWAQALLKNEKKSTQVMYSDYGGRCCLAVAQDVAIENGVEDIDEHTTEEYPDEQVASFFGWSDTNPLLEHPKGLFQASDLNDGWGKIIPKHSHAEIAECVLNTFVHPKKSKWNLLKKTEASS